MAINIGIVIASFVVMITFGHRYAFHAFMNVITAKHNKVCHGDFNPSNVIVGKNGKMTQGMAVVIVGGLTASTVLTLILLPTFYMIIHKRSKDKKAKKKAKQTKKLEVSAEENAGLIT